MPKRALILFLCFVIWGATAANACGKVQDSILVKLVLEEYGIDTVVLGQLTKSEARPAITIERSYLGDFEAGDLLPLSDERDLYLCVGETKVDDGRSPIKHVVAFVSPSNHRMGHALHASSCLEGLISQCNLRDQIDAWMLPDTFEDLAGVEQRIEAGLATRQVWQRAWATSDTTERLALLRPLFIPAEQTFLAHHDTQGLLVRALEKLDRNDLDTRRFVEELLTLPYFQESYAAPGNWRKFGESTRSELQAFLAGS